MIRRLATWALPLMLLACNSESGDPTERGLSYVASAIVASAIIRALFNK